MYADATPIDALYSMERPTGNYVVPETPHVKSSQFPPKEKFEGDAPKNKQMTINELISLLTDPLIVVVIFFILNSKTAEKILMDNLPNLVDFSLVIRAICAGGLFFVAKLLINNSSD